MESRKHRERRNDAERISATLYQAAADAGLMRRLATMLHYDRCQLETDVKQLFDFISEKAQIERDNENE